MSVKPTVLTIAASDSAGMAGVAADIRSQTALGVHCAVAVTANTAQDNNRVIQVNPVDLAALDTQLQATETASLQCIKVGLVPSAGHLKVIKTFVEPRATPLIYDPVLSSSSGTDFADKNVIDMMLREFLPHCTLITPNHNEAERLTGISSASSSGQIEVARRLLQMGARAVLIKGGHSDNGDCWDYFCSPQQSFWLGSPRIAAVNCRGTGCALSSAIAAAIARGYALADAVVIGKMAINQGLRQGYASGFGAGPVAISHFPDASQDLPVLTEAPMLPCSPFPACDEKPLGLYPIVDRANWLERLLPAGITTIQLRIKDLHEPGLRREIARAIALARRYDCRLFINDHWRLAIELGAYGVHLGQEDLNSADIHAIQRAGLRLGISTHCHYEMARAQGYRPSYLACGPIYPTTTKQMPWTPQGLPGLRYWQRMHTTPLVAIGGIDEVRLPGVARTGVSGIAMITAITKADNPEQTAAAFQKIINMTREEMVVNNHYPT